MRPTFVKIENVNRFLHALAALEDRGAEECSLMVVDGLPGLAKTTVAQWWATQNDAIFVRAKAGWTESWMLQDILQALNIVPHAHYKVMFRQILDGLTLRRDEAIRSGRTFGIVIDEIDHISRKKSLLETLRDITDTLLVVPMIWVGMAAVRANLTRHPQIASRVSQYVEFLPLTLQDTRQLVEGLCEVPVADDLIEYLHQISKGRVREIKEAIMAIERAGKLNKGAKVDRRTMAGKVLLNSRESGRPIKVEA